MAASAHAKRFLDGVYENLSRFLPPRDAEQEARIVARIWAEVLAVHLPGRSPEDVVRVEQDLADQLRSYGEPISKYESLHEFGLLMNVATQLEEGTRKAGGPIPERPLLATMPTGQINAMTLVVPGTDEHLVLFEDQLYLFAFLAAQAVTEVLPYDQHDDGSISFSFDEGRIKANIAQHPEVARRFAEVIIAYLAEGRPDAAPQLVQDRIPAVLTGVLVSSAEMFVLGHEYAHIALGHLGERWPVSRFNGTEAADPEEIRYSQAQETMADIYGLELMMRAQLTRYDVATSYGGADLYFSMSDLLDRAVSLLRHGEEDRTTYTTHPPPAVRREVLRQVLVNSVLGEEGQSALQMTEQIQAVTEMLWSRVRGALLNGHRNGARPLAVWKD